MLRVGTQTSEASFSAKKFEIKRNVLLSGRRWSLALEQRNWLRISRFCGKFHLLDRISPRRYAAETGGAVSGFRVSAITSGRKGSSRGTPVFARCFG